MSEELDRELRAVSKSMSKRLETALRAHLRKTLPFGFRWMVNHPSYLMVLFVLRPKWRPTIVVVGGSRIVYGAKHSDAYVIENFYRIEGGRKPRKRSRDGHSN